MSYLFVDSTYSLMLGILSGEWEWISFENVPGLKASAVIQGKAYDLLERNGLKAIELKGIITVNGPGFYTGLRLAEGFADVLKFFKIPAYSFYSYEIPSWCGFSEGLWFTKAYRGDYYFYRWKNGEGSGELKSVRELEPSLFQGNVFVHSELSLDEKSRAFILNPSHTADLLQQFPKKIFPEVLKKGTCEPFYFRAPEDEFKVNP